MCAGPSRPDGSQGELVRLGATICKVETTGIAWFADEAKPNSKHVPKRKRRTVIGMSDPVALPPGPRQTFSVEAGIAHGVWAVQAVQAPK